MFRKLLHQFVSKSIVYDRVQTLVGVERLYRRIGEYIGSLDQDTVVLDIGGGTGLSKSILHLPATYLCVDIDKVKLAAVTRKYGRGTAIQADASHLPIRQGAIDLALCVNVAHHLTDDRLTALLRESLRVLKDKGRLVFADPVWEPSLRIGRLIWHYDLGTNPRTPEALYAFLTREAILQSWELFTIHHRYIIGVLTRRQDQ